MKQNIQEFFVLPINTYPALSFQGIQIYSSDLLKRKFIEAMSETPKTSEMVNEIDKLVNNDMLVPAFLSSGLFSFFKNKVFTPEPIEKYKYVLGFYEPSLNKVVVLIENEIKLYGYGHAENIADVTVHELTHFCSAMRPSAFSTYFKKELNTYYYYIFNEIFSLQNNQINIDAIITLLHNSVTKSGTLDSNFLVNYYKQLKGLKKYSSLTPAQFTNKLNLYFAAINMFLKSNFDEFRQEFRRFLPITRSLYRSYINLGFKAQDTMCVQELVYPSEVIAIGTEFGTNYTQRIHRILKMAVQ